MFRCFLVGVFKGHGSWCLLSAAIYVLSRKLFITGQ